MAEESLEISSDTDEMAEAMLTASRSVVRTCMQIRPSEHVLVVTDPECSEVGQSLYEVRRGNRQGPSDDDAPFP